MLESVVLAIVAVALLVAGVALLVASLTTEGGAWVAPIAAAITAIAAVLQRWRSNRRGPGGGPSAVIVALLASASMLYGACGTTSASQKEALAEWGRCMTTAVLQCSAPLLRRATTTTTHATTDTPED